MRGPGCILNLEVVRKDCGDGKIRDMRVKEDSRMTLGFWPKQVKRVLPSAEMERTRIWMKDQKPHFGHIRFEMCILYLSGDSSGS